MSFLKRFLAPAPKTSGTEIRMGFWQVEGCRVVKTIEYVGYSPQPQTLQIALMCQWSSTGQAMIFMTLQFSPTLASDDGHLAVRLRDDALDSGMCVAEIKRLENGNTLVGRMSRDDVAKIVEVLASEGTMELWLGGPDDALLCLPLPPEPGLEAKLEQAATHPSARP